MNASILISSGRNGLYSLLDEFILDWMLSHCREAEITHILILADHDYFIQYQTWLENKKHEEAFAITLIAHEDTGSLTKWLSDMESQSCEDILMMETCLPFLTKNLIWESKKFHEQSSHSVTLLRSHETGRTIANAGWWRLRALKEHIQKRSPMDCFSYSVATLTDEPFFMETQTPLISTGSLEDLAVISAQTRQDVILRHIKNGVEFPCMDGVSIGKNVTIAPGTVILQGVILRGHTKIGARCVIGPNCLLEDTTVGEESVLNTVQSCQAVIKDRVKIGPFVHIRPNTTLESGVKIGDFVEVKNSTIGENTAIAHLTYIGDSDVGSRCNFGCGCVTANYDGLKKSRTVIGDNAFLGCQTRIIAPVTIGNGAYTAAGTTVTKNIPDNAFAIERGETVVREGLAKRWHKIR